MRMLVSFFDLHPQTIDLELILDELNYHLNLTNSSNLVYKYGLFMSLQKVFMLNFIFPDHFLHEVLTSKIGTRDLFL